MKETLTDNKRIEWIDALKGFGIFLVTFGHLRPYLPLEAYIYSFHMCLFFFISGYLFKCKSTWVVFFLKKCKSLLLPFIIWFALSTIVGIILGDIIIFDTSFFLCINDSFSWNEPIWFLLVLFMTECLYALIMKLNDSWITSLAIVIVGMALWFFWFTHGAVRLPLKINLVTFAIAYYAMGDLLKKEPFNCEKNPAFLMPSFIFLATISVYFGALKNIRMSYLYCDFGNIKCCIVASIAGTLLYFGIFKNIKFFSRLHVLNILGKNSMIIMCAQYWVFRFLDVLTIKYYGASIWHDRGTLKAFLFAVVTVTIIVLFASVLKKIFKNSSKILCILKIFGIQ